MFTFTPPFTFVYATDGHADYIMLICLRRRRKMADAIYYERVSERER